MYNFGRLDFPNQHVSYAEKQEVDYYALLNGKSFADRQKSLKEKPITNNQKVAEKTAPAKATNTSSETTAVASSQQSAKTVEQIKNKQDVIVKNNAQNEKAEFVYYKVCKGDNFWSIAKKFPGVTNIDIMKLNNITKATSLKDGQILKILPKA